MYNQTYEEYMRNVLDYIPSYQKREGTYRNDGTVAYQGNPIHTMQNHIDPLAIEEMYPEIYKIVYPMVRKACTNGLREITEEAIEKITMEIFTMVEESMEVENRANVQNKNKRVDMKNTTRIEENRNKSENRNHNFLLKDLIQILVLRELLENTRTPRKEARPMFPEEMGARSPLAGGFPQTRNYDTRGIFY